MVLFVELNVSSQGLFDYQAKTKWRNPSQNECFKILEQYHLPVPAYQTVRSADQAVSAAMEIGFPVVLKMDLPSILHKSDVGGVTMNLAGTAAVRTAFDEMSGRLKAQLPLNEEFTALVMKQADPGGQEVIMGVKWDRTFGATLLFGVGGVLAELIDHVSLRLIPVDANDIMEMIREIKGFRVLSGTLGRTPKEIDSKYPSKSGSHGTGFNSNQ